MGANSKWPQQSNSAPQFETAIEFVTTNWLISKESQIRLASIQVGGTLSAAINYNTLFTFVKLL